jgi:hypothetical protein
VVLLGDILLVKMQNGDDLETAQNNSNIPEAAESRLQESPFSTT